MARQTVVVAKPQASPGYFAVLVLTLVAIVGGIGLIVLEMGEYGWQSEAKVSPPPKVTPLEPAQPNAAPAPAPQGGPGG